MKVRPLSAVAFTLIELLTVMAVIAILAGLILGTAGYVQKAAARKRAATEIAAMEAALESYKADNGVYPETQDPGETPEAGGNADVLYQALTGDGNSLLGGSPGVGSNQQFGTEGKVYMEPKPNQLNSAGTSMQDPFGAVYNFVSPGLYNPATFDLWAGPQRPNSDPSSQDNIDWENAMVHAKNW